jgi:hypothetical protein
MDCLGCFGAAELHHTYCLSLLARPSRRGSTKAHALTTPIKKGSIGRLDAGLDQLGSVAAFDAAFEWQTRARSLMRWQQRRASGSRRVAAIAAAGATFKSLGDLWRDTATSHRWLMLTVLGGFADFRGIKRACGLTQAAGLFGDEAFDSSPSGRSSSQVALEFARRCGLSISLSRRVRLVGRLVF